MVARQSTRAGDAGVPVASIATSGTGVSGIAGLTVAAGFAACLNASANAELDRQCAKRPTALPDLQYGIVAQDNGPVGLNWACGPVDAVRFHGQVAPRVISIELVEIGEFVLERVRRRFSGPPHGPCDGH